MRYQSHLRQESFDVRNFFDTCSLFGRKRVNNERGYLHRFPLLSPPNRDLPNSSGIYMADHALHHYRRATGVSHLARTQLEHQHWRHRGPKDIVSARKRPIHWYHRLPPFACGGRTTLLSPHRYGLARWPRLYRCSPPTLSPCDHATR